MYLALIRDNHKIKRIKNKCECGGCYTIYPEQKVNNKTRHENTKRHKNFELKTSVFLEINKHNK